MMHNNIRLLSSLHTLRQLASLPRSTLPPVAALRKEVHKWKGGECEEEEK